jgi:hypothetical protein
MATFEDFWAAYPHKVGKLAARRIWDRLKVTPEMGDTLVAAVVEQAHSAQWTKEHGAFVPHPKTWLNQGRWMDELAPATPQRGQMPTYDFGWCQHEPPCNSRTWHEVLIDRESRAARA